MSSPSREDEKLPEENEAAFDPISLIDPSEVDNLTRIATQQSRRQSTTQAAHRLKSIAEQDSSFDPQSPNFNLRKWIVAAMNDVGLDQGQKTGIIFRNLNIYGSGSELRFQETVSSFLTAPLRLGEALRKAPSKRILKDFNGLLKSGELLLVLGRPGAGCSTMLKALCGKLHGLEIGQDSVIHYNGKKCLYCLLVRPFINSQLLGIPLRRMIKEFRGEVVYNQEVIMSLF